MKLRDCSQKTMRQARLWKTRGDAMSIGTKFKTAWLDLVRSDPGAVSTYLWRRKFDVRLIEFEMPFLPRAFDLFCGEVLAIHIDRVNL